MSFLLGLAEFVAGMLFRGMWSSHNWHKREFQLKLRRTELELREAALAERTTQLATQPKPRPDELTASIAEDALRRERRAKAAIWNMLKQQGCTEAQIEDVISTIDNVEAGDLESRPPGY